MLGWCEGLTSFLWPGLEWFFGRSSCQTSATMSHHDWAEREGYQVNWLRDKANWICATTQAKCCGVKLAEFKKKTLKFRPVLLWIKTYYYYYKKSILYIFLHLFWFLIVSLHLKKMYLLVFSNLQDTLPFRQAATLLSHVYFAFHKLLKCADAEYWFGFCLYCLNEWVPPSLGCGGHLAEILLRAAGKAGVRRVLFV